MEFINNRDKIWLYSTTYGNFWWSYDNDNCEKLDLIYNDYKKRLDNSKNEEIKNVNVMDEITGNEDDIKNPTFGEVCFEDCNSDEEKSESDDDINNMLSYNLNIGNIKLYIDFDDMKQINYTNNRARKIRLLEFPVNVPKEERKNYAIKNNVIGISGKLFKSILIYKS